MTFEHQQLASGKWFDLTFFAQMSNIGSEVERAIIWQPKNSDYSLKSFYRALELLDLTLADKKNNHRLYELARVREALVDFFQGSNIFVSSNHSWQSYFRSFNYAYSLEKGL